jgi:hypothetical protein
MPSITPPAAVAPAPSSSGGDASVFSQTEYEENTAKVVAHAAATGRAVVVGVDGRPRVIITIPTQDLPTLDE